MDIKRIFKLLFWNKLQQFRYQTSFRRKGIKRGGAIERGLYSYNIGFVNLGNNVKLKKNWRIPAYSITAGIPAKVIKQYDLNEKKLKNVKSGK